MSERVKRWTPGPWGAVDNGNYFDISTADDDLNPCIGNVCASKFLPGGNNERSNAQLISAAPDLVEALESAVKVLKTRSATSDLESALIIAEAALAKAYGEQP